MPASWAFTPPYFLLFGFLCGATGFRVGWRIGNRVALPLSQAALGWTAFLLAWSILGPAWAAATVGAWVLGTTMASVPIFVGDPAATDLRVLRAAPYRATMLAWLESGDGAERRPAATAWQHLREAIWYAAAGISTANLGSIVMGAVLLNYMNAWVATLLRAAKSTGRVLLLAWNIWSVVRVAAYVLIGAAAASPLLRLCGWRADVTTVTALAEAGAGGVALDLILKIALSRPCVRALAAGVDLEAAKANRSPKDPLMFHFD
jgi:hypothetical protein